MSHNFISIQHNIFIFCWYLCLLHGIFSNSFYDWCFFFQIYQGANACIYILSAVYVHVCGQYNKTENEFLLRIHKSVSGLFSLFSVSLCTMFRWMLIFVHNFFFKFSVTFIEFVQQFHFLVITSADAEYLHSWTLFHWFFYVTSNIYYWDFDDDRIFFSFCIKL